MPPASPCYIRRVATPLEPRRGPFAALVAAACSDAGASEGLAAAYAALPAPERARMVEAVVCDARLEDVSPAAALVALLGVETERDLALAIFAALRETGGEGLEVRGRERALWEGDAHRGSAVLICPLFGGFTELFSIAWDPSGVRRVASEPLLDGEDLERRLASLPQIGALAPIPFGRALDRITTVLWRHIRAHKQPPDGIARLASWL